MAQDHNNPGDMTTNNCANGLMHEACALGPPIGLTIETMACRRVVDDACELDISVQHAGRGSLQNPAWSPNSMQLLVTYFPEGYNRGPPLLLVVSLQTGVTREVARGVSLPGNSNTWTSQCRFVYSHDADGDAELLFDMFGVFPVTGEQAYVSQFGPPACAHPSPITNYPDHAWEPSLSPAESRLGGRFVVFQDRFSRTIQLTAVHDDFAVRRHQTYMSIADPTLLAVKQPVWSGAGDLIVYQGRRTGAWKLYLITVPDDPPQLAANPAAASTELRLVGSDASFSPDGNALIYSGVTEPESLHVAPILREDNAPPSVGVPFKVTHTQGMYEGAPGWSPSGDLVAYEACEGTPAEAGRTTVWVTALPGM